MLERIKELNKRGYSNKEIEDLLGLESSVVDAIITNELWTLDGDSIKKFYEIFDIYEEFGIVLPDIIDNSLAYSEKENAVYLGKDKVNIHLSKSGNMYFTVKNQYIRIKYIREKILEKVVEKQLEHIKDIAELPRYQVKEYKSKFSDKVYWVWFCNDYPKFAVIKEHAENRLKEQIKSIEYRNLIEEKLYVHRIIKPAIEQEIDEIYSSKEPEDFVVKVAECEEFMSVLLEMKNRKISGEEAIMLREIKEMIDDII